MCGNTYIYNSSELRHMINRSYDGCSYATGCVIFVNMLFSLYFITAVMIYDKHAYVVQHVTF